jgi:hypothetical protein
MEYIRSYFSKNEDIGASNPQEISLVENSDWLSEGITYNRFLDAYEKMDESLPLKITIQTYGGNVTNFLPIARVLANHQGETTAVVRRYAYSGGTILCLMCDKIVMSKYSILGAINPYMYIPINTNHIKKATEAINQSWMKVLFEYFADMEQSVLDQLKLLLLKKYSESDIETIIQFFVYKYNHNVPIYYDMVPEVIRNKIVLIDNNTNRKSDEQRVSDYGMVPDVIRNKIAVSDNDIDELNDNVDDDSDDDIISNLKIKKNKFI